MGQLAVVLRQRVLGMAGAALHALLALLRVGDGGPDLGAALLRRLQSAVAARC